MRLTTSSLSSLTDNLEEVLHIDCKSNLEYMTANDGLLFFKCMEYSNTYEKRFDQDLSKRFKNYISVLWWRAKANFVSSYMGANFVSI